MKRLSAFWGSSRLFGFCWCMTRRYCFYEVGWFNYCHFQLLAKGIPKDTPILTLARVMLALQSQHLAVSFDQMGLSICWRSSSITCTITLHGYFNYIACVLDTMYGTVIKQLQKCLYKWNRWNIFTQFTRVSDTLLLRHRWLLLAFPYQCVATDMDWAISWTQPCLWSVYIEESCIALQISIY